MKRKKGQQIEMFAAPPSPEPVKAAPITRDLTPQAENLLANFEVLADGHNTIIIVVPYSFELGISIMGLLTWICEIYST